MSEIQYYIIDLETTGTLKIHEVCEVSIIRCKDKVQLTECVKCRFPQNASYDALTLTGKTYDDLKQGMSKREVVDKINKFLNEDGLSKNYRCFIGHKVSFDKRFLTYLYQDVGEELPAIMWLCTLQLSKLYAKKNDIKTKFDLHSSCDIFNIKKIAKKHSAKTDTRNTFFLWEELKSKIDYIPHIKCDFYDRED